MPTETANPPEIPIPESKTEPDGWSRSIRGNPYVVRTGIHATLSVQPTSDATWMLFSTTHGKRSQTDLGNCSEATAKKRAEQFLNIERSMRQTRIARCRQMVQAGAKAPPHQRDTILDLAARLAAHISAELQELPNGRHRTKDQQQLDAVIAAGSAARNAPAML